MLAVPWLDPRAGQRLLGQPDRRDPDLVVVCRQREPAFRLCRAALVRPGALFRLRHVRRRRRHRPVRVSASGRLSGLASLLQWQWRCVSGIFAVRLTWHYFAIITVVFSLIFYFLAVTQKWLTGGDDGINFTLPPTFSFGGTQLLLHQCKRSSISLFWPPWRSASI